MWKCRVISIGRNTFPQNQLFGLSLGLSFNLLANFLTKKLGNASDAFKVLPVITYILAQYFFFFAFNFCYWKLDLKHVLKDSISQDWKIKRYRQNILKFKFLPLFETLLSNLV